jgi:hypothetical protein
MSFTLATLKSTVQDYLQVNETTFNNNLNTFIQESESRIFKMVQLPEQRKNVQGTLTASNRFLATPSDYYAPFSLAVIDSNNKYHYLDFKHPSFIKEYSPVTTTTGRPKYYSLFDEAAFELSPDSRFWLHGRIALPVQAGVTDRWQRLWYDNPVNGSSLIHCCTAPWLRLLYF